MAFFCIHCKSEVDPNFRACPYCGEAITDFLRRYLEAPIDGKYQILARLGVGGMGEVYKVLHVHLNAIRVIKLMRPNLATDPGAHERFLREARLATKIHHPNVAALFDFSTLGDGTHYMVWEYIEGTNLHEVIDQRGPLSPRYAAMLSAQALMGLEAIHRAGIVHRDVSPENLMLTHDDDGNETVKIIDLGIAKSSSADDNNTKTGMFVGKWKYCSPEHLGMLPSGERIDGRADLYSFGIVLYEMLTGVPPFQADTPHAYLMMHSQQRPPALRENNPRVAAPPELESVIFRALEKDRTARFQTAKEFARELERLAPSLSDAAGAPPPALKTVEVTSEATRVAQQELATVVSIQQDAPTVVTKVLERVEPAAIEPPRRSRALATSIAALVLLGLALGGWFVLRDKAPAVAKPAVARAPSVVPPPSPVAASAAPVPATLPGHLAINAFPWAEVTSIRNVGNGEQVDLGASLVTPAPPVDLAPGTYEVTLRHPQFTKPITRMVSIAAGAEQMLNVQFVDPAAAPLPDFGGAP